MEINLNTECMYAMALYRCIQIYITDIGVVVAVAWCWRTRLIFSCLFMCISDLVAEERRQFLADYTWRFRRVFPSFSLIPSTSIMCRCEHLDGICLAATVI